MKSNLYFSGICAPSILPLLRATAVSAPACRRRSRYCTPPLPVSLLRAAAAPGHPLRGGGGGRRREEKGARPSQPTIVSRSLAVSHSAHCARRAAPHPLSPPPCSPAMPRRAHPRLPVEPHSPAVIDAEACAADGGVDLGDRVGRRR